MVLLYILLFHTTGCATTDQKWDRNQTIANIGKFKPLPYGYKKSRLGIMPFQDKTGGKKRGLAASDQITTLWIKSKRFQVIEREQLKSLLKEQNMQGIVKDKELALKGKIRGCEYLCLGSITNFEVSKKASSFGSGVLRFLGGVTAIAGAATGNKAVELAGIGISLIDINFSSEELNFHIGVDVRIVDTKTGYVAFADSADVKRQETVKAMGLSIAGIGVDKKGKITIDSKNQGRLLRLALDEVIKKMLPEIDKKFTKLVKFKVTVKTKPQKEKKQEKTQKEKKASSQKK